MRDRTEKRTSDLERHLKSKHPEHYKQKEEALRKKKEKIEKSDNSQPKLVFTNEIQITEPENDGPGPSKKTKFSTTPIKKAFTQWDASSDKTRDMEKTIMEYICVDGLPFLTVEKAGFKRLMHKAQSQFQIKSRWYYCNNVLPEIFDRMFSRVKNDLKTVEFISLTTDLWSSKENSHSLLDTFDIRIAIIGKLDQLMDKEKTENNKSLIIATVLDPRFKLKLFEQMKEQIREWMRNGTAVPFLCELVNQRVHVVLALCANVSDIWQRTVCTRMDNQDMANQGAKGNGNK
ncbi:hypothetical protein niasHS_000121 [Heterodera schachtii]|uniref:Transposase n=1 Tax=Heterodera schachtii TaxID=97005 RepID=A0ABD2K732_HETSC